MSVKLKVEAYAGLLRHYREIFRFSWNNRRASGGNLFTASEAEFLPAALSLQERPVSPAARWTAKILVGLLIALILWAILGKIDIVVNASGKIIPSGRTKEIASVDVAKVVALHVEDGQTVRAGEDLIDLDADASNAELDKATADATAARLQEATARALIAAVNHRAPPRLPPIPGTPRSVWRSAQAQLAAQYQDVIAQLRRLDSDIADYREELPLATQRARDDAALAKDHDVSTHDWLKREQARVDLAGKLADAVNQRTTLIADTKQTAYASLTAATKALADAEAEIAKAAAQSGLMTLTAPVDGTVQQLTVHTVGGVVPAAQTLMVIVPRQPRIEVDARIADKDIGFIRVGQRASVKIDAFDYTRYGAVPAHVTEVSQDAIRTKTGGLVYTVRLLLAKSTIFVDGRAMPLSPGMAVKVGIRTGKRRIIEYFLSPLKRYQRDSLHER